MTNIVTVGDKAATSYEAITVADTAIGFTATKIKPTNATAVQGVFCSLETAQIRFTLDGTTPTSTIGHLLGVGQTLTISHAGDIENFRAIRTGSTSGSLRCTYRF